MMSHGQRASRCRRALRSKAADGERQPRWIEQDCHGVPIRKCGRRDERLRTEPRRAVNIVCDVRDRDKELREWPFLRRSRPDATVHASVSLARPELTITQSILLRHAPPE